MSSFPFSKSIFWDVDVDKVNLHLQKDFIIQRVFLRGGMKDVKTIFSLYPLGDIIEALKKSRELDKVTHNFCSNYFNIPKEEMHAPSEFYQ
jgi:hypothetical protein